MSFSKTKVVFTLRDIGSELIDQLSTDIYTKPEAILREVVKNSYDAYLKLNPDDFQDESLPRQIVIRRERDADGTGRLFISDRAVGQSIDDIKANVQISISRKKEEINFATGFRGLGSWAIIGAGSRITITSKRKGKKPARLIINVREIYKRLGSETTLDDILNNAKCIAFFEDDSTGDPQDHYTITEIECDGPVETINPGKTKTKTNASGAGKQRGRYEINRLHAFTDPKDKELRKILLRSCPIPYSKQSLYFKEISEIYHQAHYARTEIVLEGETLERCVPSTLTKFGRVQLKVGNKIAAAAWFAEQPEDAKNVAKHVTSDCNIERQSLQLVKYNVPIGPKALFATQEQSRLLDWYVGEIHLIPKDILPDASGETLRAGTATDAFVTSLSDFYDTLVKSARDKSLKLNFIESMHDGTSAAKQLAEAEKKKEVIPEGERIELLNAVKTAVHKIHETKAVRRHGDDDASGEHPLLDPEVQKARKEARDFLKEGAFLDKFKANGSPARAKKKATATDAKQKQKLVIEGAAGKYVPLEDFQARLGRAIPRLAKLGLDEAQIREVLDIIDSVLKDFAK